MQLLHSVQLLVLEKCFIKHIYNLTPKRFFRAEITQWIPKPLCVVPYSMKLRTTVSTRQKYFDTWWTMESNHCSSITAKVGELNIWTSKACGANDKIWEILNSPISHYEHSAQHHTTKLNLFASYCMQIKQVLVLLWVLLHLRATGVFQRSLSLFNPIWKLSTTQLLVPSLPHPQQDGEENPEK